MQGLFALQYWQQMQEEGSTEEMQESTTQGQRSN